MTKIIKIGTRKSRLALIQTSMVIEQIKAYSPDIDCQIVPIITTGDMIKDKALYDVGGKALFLKEIENALTQGEIDLAVHSLKDVPCKLPPGLTIGAVLRQEDAREVLISKNGYKTIESLPQGSIVGTSSVRRKILIKNIRPDLTIVPLRGNVDSRVKKLFEEKIDAIILACCGLKRLGLFNPQYCNLIEIEQMLPPVGQGVIAIEIRKDNIFMHEICNMINHLKTWQLIQPGRVFLEYINADCKTPLAVYSQYVKDDIHTKFMLANFEGTKILSDEVISNLKDCKSSAINIAKKFITNL